MTFGLVLLCCGGRVENVASADASGLRWMSGGIGTGVMTETARRRPSFGVGGRVRVVMAGAIAGAIRVGMAVGAGASAGVVRF